MVFSFLTFCSTISLGSLSSSVGSSSSSSSLSDSSLYCLLFCYFSLFFLFVLNLVYHLIFYFPEKVFDILFLFLYCHIFFLYCDFKVCQVLFEFYQHFFNMFLSAFLFFAINSIHAKNSIKKFTMVIFFLHLQIIFFRQLILFQNPRCCKHFLL